MCGNRQKATIFLCRLKSVKVHSNGYFVLRRYVYVIAVGSVLDKDMWLLHLQPIIVLLLVAGRKYIHTSTIKFIALSISPVFYASAMAQNISKNNYKAVNEKISVEFKSANAGCRFLSGNANDI